MPRFTVTRQDAAVAIAFDDGGMNLLSSAALDELAGVIKSLAGDRSIEQLVFRSGRERLFAAGADMAEMRRFSSRDAYAFAEKGQELFATIERLPFATTCFIDGDCFGGALDLAMAFDFRVATPRSRFSHPGAKIGIVTGFGGTSRWRSIFDEATARRMFLANEILSAGEARGAGVVDWTVADAGAMPAAGHEVTGSRGHTVSFAFVKELARVSQRLSKRETLLFARRLAALTEG